MTGPVRVAIVTVSDGVASGNRTDLGGPACEKALADSGIAHEVVSRETVADEPKQIARIVRTRSDSEEVDVVVLTGGTGLSPRDRTPEAVREVIDFEAPGLAEKMRAETGRDFAAAYLSRQVAGVRGHALVLALPGSPRGAGDCLRAVAELLPHAVSLARGEKPDHPRPESEDGAA